MLFEYVEVDMGVAVLREGSRHARSRKSFERAVSEHLASGLRTRK
jgi:hypothetical protein